METIDYKQKIIDYMNSSEVDTLYKSMLNNLFPELKESEDERIRKAMIDFFKHEREEGITVLHYGVNIERMIDWLEKQGEQPKKHDVCDNCDQQDCCVSPYPMKLVEKQDEQKPVDNMEQYIPKAAVLAEIERLVNNHDKALDYEAALEDVRNFIDSLEVKESAKIEREKETCKENGDSLTQENVSEVWHDAQTEQPQAKKKILATNEYGACKVDFAINMALYWKKVIKWAYIEDLLNI